MSPEQPPRDVEIFPLLTWHYGLSFEELCRMPRFAIRLYAGAIAGLVAERQLLALQASSFPYMTDSARESLCRRLERQAGWEEPIEVIPREELAETLAGMGIGLVVS